VLAELEAAIGQFEALGETSSRGGLEGHLGVFALGTSLNVRYTVKSPIQACVTQPAWMIVGWMETMALQV